MPLQTETPSTPALSYLLGHWYFADPGKTRVARVVGVSESYARVEFHQLETPGDLESEVSGTSGNTWIASEAARQRVNATRKAIGENPIRWSRLTRHMAGVADVDEPIGVERGMRRDEQAVAEEVNLPDTGDLADIPASELESSKTRKELGPNNEAVALLSRLDRLMGEFEEKVMLVNQPALAPDYLARLESFAIPAGPIPRGLERALGKARETGKPMDVQDAIFEAIGSAVAMVRQAKDIVSVEDIVQDAPLREAPKAHVTYTQPSTEGLEQGNLLTGDFEQVTNAQRGRPNHQVAWDEIPDQDLPMIARVMTGNSLPSLTVEEARAIVRPRLKSPEAVSAIREIVARESAKRSGPAAPGA